MCKRLVPMSLCLLALALLLASTAHAADPTLIGWWPFDEVEGDIAYDMSNYANDATLVAEAIEWAPDGGRFGGALLYSDIQTDYVQISTADMSTTAGTVAIWGYLDADQTSDREHYFFGHTTIPAFGSRIQLYMDVGDTDLDLGLGDAHTRATAMTTLDTETWYHIALTWNNGQYVVYLDGKVIQDGSYSGLTALNETASIGNDGNTDNEVEGFKGYLDECRLYNRALSQAEVQAVMAKGFGLGLAKAPTPADEATEVLCDAVLSWGTGEFAATHDVYFGTSFDDVNDASRDNPMDVLVSQGQSDAAYAPTSALEFGVTYYWRIDEVNAAPDYAIFKGDVWSFSTEPLGYPIENVIATSSVPTLDYDPQLTVDGSGLNDEGEHSVEADDMWQADATDVDSAWIQYEFDQAYKLYELLVWNYNIQFEMVLGFGVKDVTIEYSTDGATWTVLGDFEFAQAPSATGYTANTTVDFAGVKAQYVRLTINSNYGGSAKYGLSEVQFLYSPVQARYPQPTDGQTDVSPTGTLSWRAGREAASHEVYLSTDEAAVADGTALVDTVVEPSYDMDSLGIAYSHTYFWKVTEVNEAEAISAWESAVWSFTTQAFRVLDDFESYNDDDNLIYETWIDGWTNGTGSVVGYFEAPFAETEIVNGGLQSMPLTYDNSVSPYYSEAEFALGNEDWTANGIDTLSLSVYGQAPAFAETADGTIAVSAIGADIWGTTDAFRYVYKTLNGDGSIIARVDYLDGTPNAWAKAGVMIRQNTDTGSMHALTALTGGDGGGAAFQRRLTTDGDSASDHGLAEGPFAPPTWVKLERSGNAISSFLSVDGETWIQAGSTITIAMTDPVLVGLATTSHDATVATSAVYSNIGTTGNVTGQWQMAEIGATQPTGGNDPAELYVALEDASGNVAKVTNAYAAVISIWQEWQIPLSEFAGIDLSNVATIYVGLGDRDNPSAGGTGTVYIDDVGVGHPAASE